MNQSTRNILLTQFHSPDIRIGTFQTFILYNLQENQPLVKKTIISGFIAMVCFCACSKQMPLTPDGKTNSEQSYIKHSIFAGKHYSNKNGLVSVKTSNLSFKVKFDSSAIYSTVKAKNQTSINKLFGFSDNNATHHQYSARFGWRWSDNALRIFAYTYNAGTRSFVELGKIQPGIENDCSIAVYGDKYIFSLNGAKTAMPRASTTEEAEGYRLYPYFGGDETAPHDIFIWIKEVPTPDENR